MRSDAVGFGDGLATAATPGKPVIQYVRTGNQTCTDASPNGLRGKIRWNVMPKQQTDHSRAEHSQTRPPPVMPSISRDQCGDAHRERTQQKCGFQLLRNAGQRREARERKQHRSGDAVHEADRGD